MASGYLFPAAMVGIMVVPAVVVGPALAIAGFGALGPVAGGIAAGIQTAGGPIVGGSAFAVLQSAAMGGYGAAIVNSVVTSCAGIVAAGAVIMDNFVSSEMLDILDEELLQKNT